MKELVLEMQNFFGFIEEDSNNEHSESRETSSEVDKIGFLNDICFENKVLNQCGFGLSEEESYLIYTSIKTFNKKQNANNTRFWGKIFGLNYNYYVIITETEEKELEEENNLEVKLIFYFKLLIFFII